MNSYLKKLLIAAPLLLGLLFSTQALGQDQKSSCEKSKKTACCSSASAKESTSGCSPSACRGAKTKFGEAKVITDLRLSLIALKADMEKSTSPKFEKRSYDIHGIVGETDDESLAILVKEVKLVEDAFLKEMQHQTSKFDLPENKAKQVQYLSTRIDELKQLL